MANVTTGLRRAGAGELCNVALHNITADEHQYESVLSRWKLAGGNWFRSEACKQATLGERKLISSDILGKGKSRGSS
jgi:hypothetical protein